MILRFSSNYRINVEDSCNYLTLSNVRLPCLFEFIKKAWQAYYKKYRLPYDKIYPDLMLTRAICFIVISIYLNQQFISNGVFVRI